MLTWNRCHNNNDDDWPIRPDGFFDFGPPPELCCILLETGAPDEILLEDDSGCVALEAC